MRHPTVTLVRHQASLKAPAHSSSACSTSQAGPNSCLLPPSSFPQAHHTSPLLLGSCPPPPSHCRTQQSPQFFLFEAQGSTLLMPALPSSQSFSRWPSPASHLSPTNPPVVLT